MTNIKWKLTEKFKIPKDFMDEVTFEETEMGYDIIGPEHVLDELMRRLPDLHTLLLSCKEE